MTKTDMTKTDDDLKKIIWSSKSDGDECFPNM